MRSIAADGGEGEVECRSFMECRSFTECRSAMECRSAIEVRVLEKCHGGQIAIEVRLPQRSECHRGQRSPWKCSIGQRSLQRTGTSMHYNLMVGDVLRHLMVGDVPNHLMVGGRSEAPDGGGVVGKD